MLREKARPGPVHASREGAQEVARDLPGGEIRPSRDVTEWPNSALRRTCLRAAQLRALHSGFMLLLLQQETPPKVGEWAPSICSGGVQHRRKGFLRENSTPGKLASVDKSLVGGSAMRAVARKAEVRRSRTACENTDQLEWQEGERSNGNVA